MLKTTDFGGINSAADLHLVLQKLVIAPAKPKTNYVDVPGADGSKDLTEALGVGVKYKDRTITWTFAVQPGYEWAETQMAVSNAINGRACHITISDDLEYYYDGRVSVDSHKSDGLLRQITVKATCRPYKLRQQPTEVHAALTTSYQTLSFMCDRKPVVPTFVVTAATTISWGGETYALSAGTHVLPGIQFVEGLNSLQAKLTNSCSTAQTLTVKYQEGAL